MFHASESLGKMKLGDEEMSFLKKRLILLITIIVLLLLSACGGSKKSKIIGNWKAVQGDKVKSYLVIG